MMLQTYIALIQSIQIMVEWINIKCGLRFDKTIFTFVKFCYRILLKKMYDDLLLCNESSLIRALTQNNPRIQNMDTVFQTCLWTLQIIIQLKWSLSFNPLACYIFWRTRRYKSIYNLKIYTIEMLIHHSINAFFFSALKWYMTCHAIYWQKARTKSKDIGGSDRVTAVCVCQRVNFMC
jgi:hypothetical protein